MPPAEGFEYINHLAGSGVPFVCLVNFKGTEVKVWPLSELSSEELMFDINGKTNCNQNQQPELNQWHVTPLGFEQYQKAYGIVQLHLRRGDSYLINLTAETGLQSNLGLEQLYQISKAKYKVLLKNTFVAFSPEPFVKIEQGSISAFPMKGTISAKVPDAKERILNDEKESEEHNTIVDLLRNDLSRVATQVTVKEFRYLELVTTSQEDLWQVSSKITGKLDRDHWSNLGTILQDLLPAGSISGAPKKRTMEIIEQAENYDRGYFTGIFGLFDGSTFDSGVLIRFVEQTASGLKFKSGGGITVNSDVRKEYNEMISKVYVPTV